MKFARREQILGANLLLFETKQRIKLERSRGEHAGWRNSLRKASRPRLRQMEFARSPTSWSLAGVNQHQ
jgi:hypothetical protein